MQSDMKKKGKSIEKEAKLLWFADSMIGNDVQRPLVRVCVWHVGGTLRSVWLEWSEEEGLWEETK